MRLFNIIFLLYACFFLSITWGGNSALVAQELVRERIVAYGEYPAAQEVAPWEPEKKLPPEELLIPYREGGNYKQKAFIEAAHFLNARVYGYTFHYQPGSRLMKTEERFEVQLKGRIAADSMVKTAEGVEGTTYRVKVGFNLSPSVSKWISAFSGNTVREASAEGTSEFFTGWEGRDQAYRETLKNLVLAAARRELSSKPLLLKGDILLTENPVFSVGAGRHYCKLKGLVNFVEVVTYD